MTGLAGQTGQTPLGGNDSARLNPHHGRIRSEAAFAALAGVSPVPASSGNTVRHRLNHHGDRQLNMDLDIIVKLRMVRDETTGLYAARRTGGGRPTGKSNAS
jgi:transposase